MQEIESTNGDDGLSDYDSEIDKLVDSTSCSDDNVHTAKKKGHC